MLLWISILLFIDSGIALWNEHRIGKVLPRWNIKIIALAESFIAMLLTILHFWIRR